MSVPENIRSVQRPKNTVVVDTGSNSVLRYAVRERKGTVYVPGGNPQPRNGKIIGHIIDFKFVPVKSAVAENGPAQLCYGNAAFAKSVSADLYADLLDVYPASDACTIMAMASLRVCDHGIKCGRLASAYQASYISVYYPGAALSKNSVSTFLKKLGMDERKQQEFYARRLDRVCTEHHLAIDGTLKQNTSTVNTLSDMSYKFKMKGVPDISILYCYDVEEMEPVCSKVFPGNCIDAGAYPEFIKSNNIQKGIIVNDKGFPPDAIADELKSRPELHYFTPIKRDDKRIEKYNLLQPDEIVMGIDKPVVAKKVQLPDGRHLYAFKDLKASAREEYNFVFNAQRKGKFDSKKYNKKEDTFGVIVFESDVDLAVDTAYLCYDSRWQIELMFKHYKSDEELTETNVQGNYSVIGSEFINFVSTVLTCRMVSKAKKAGVLNKTTYGDMLKDLSQIWRAKDCPVETSPRISDGNWFSPIKKNNEILVSLGLATGEEFVKTPAKRGRPKKQPSTENDQADKPKRPRGRPRKNPAQDEAADKPKRPRGRPKKNPDTSAASDKPKRPRGRPRKNPEQSERVDKPKRPRGRPRKNSIVG